MKTPADLKKFLKVDMIEAIETKYRLIANDKFGRNRFPKLTQKPFPLISSEANVGRKQTGKANQPPSWKEYSRT